MNKKSVFDKIKEYHFEFKHLTVLFIILFLFQMIISLINKASIKHFLSNTQEWYQKDSAEKMANLTTTSIELLLESVNSKETIDEEEYKKLIQSFNILLSQQTLQHNIEEICIIVSKDGVNYAIDDGTTLYKYLTEGTITKQNNNYKNALLTYETIANNLKKNEEIYSIINNNNNTFNIFVPFIIEGEYVGAVYMKNTPDFSFIKNQIVSNYDETSIIYLSLIMLGLLAMYFISSYTVKERDEAQKLLFEENEKSLKKQINYEKELVFTKRIYHTHHKAEKIMGFIKEDLRKLSPDNINEINYRVTKYSNFISRVIYDMKWFDPPIQTIRNSVFKTDINEVIKFLVRNIFLRLSSKSSAEFKLNLSSNLPPIHVNEFVIWEIIEPLIQNCVEHGGEGALTIFVETSLNEVNETILKISDNGKGVDPSLLEYQDGVKRLFLENVTTKTSTIQNTGYGCYIANEMCKKCGWSLDAVNVPDSGCSYIITIKN